MPTARCLEPLVCCPFGRWGKANEPISARYSVEAATNMWQMVTERMKSARQRLIEPDAINDRKDRYKSQSSSRPRVGTVGLQKQAVDFVVWVSQKLQSIH